MRKYIFIVAILIIAILGYNYVFQDHRNIASEEPEFVLTADALLTQFSNTPSNSETKYLNKTILVSGTITEINQTNLTLNNHVFCVLTTPDSTLNIGSLVRVKGRFIGFDDLLEEIKLDQCHLIDQ